MEMGERGSTPTSLVLNQLIFELHDERTWYICDIEQRKKLSEIGK
jgi:hypothetical protein